MSIHDQDRNELIRYRISQAEETISDVELLIENGRLRSAVNRIYYGMFYSLLALGLAYEFETSKHIQLIGWFNKTFIHTNRIESKYGKMLNKAFNRRTKSDYDTFIEYEEDAVLEMFEEMKLFILEIKRFLKNGVN